MAFMTSNANFENCNCKIACTLIILGNRNCINFLYADSKFQNIQAMIVEKMECESERQISYDLTSEFAASFQNSLAGRVAVSVGQLPESTLAQK